MDEFDLGPLYSSIGEAASRDSRLDPVGVWMYVEAGDGWAEVSLFKDVGDRIVYRGASPELFDLVRKAWEAIPPDRKWDTITYEIMDGTFDMAFFYQDDFASDDPDEDRRETFLRKRFGEKPVDYSDPEPGA